MYYFGLTLIAVLTHVCQRFHAVQLQATTGLSGLKRDLGQPISGEEGCKDLLACCQLKSGWDHSSARVCVGVFKNTFSEKSIK